MSVMNKSISQEIYESLKSGYELGLRRDRASLSQQTGVEITPLQIKILAATKAHAHTHGREFTALEQRQFAHMIYGWDV